MRLQRDISSVILNGAEMEVLALPGRSLIDRKEIVKYFYEVVVTNHLLEEVGQ